MLILIALTIDMLRPAKFPAKSATQALSTQRGRYWKKVLGSQTNLTELNPEAQAALPDNLRIHISIKHFLGPITMREVEYILSISYQKTAIIIETKKS